LTVAEEGIEVAGAHEHALEHQAHGGDGLSRQIAVFTALLAAFGAVVGYLGGHTQNEALLFKNEAVLMKAHASDQWAYYQAKSTKQRLMEMAASLGPEDKREYYQAQARRYDEEQKEIKLKAEEFDHKSAEADDESRHALFPHTRLAQAMSAIQIAIALASVTALTRQRWLLAPALFSAAAAIALVAVAYA
jgi:hypothetical protein